MGIGFRIREARERLNLTQIQLGKLIGVTGSAITNYENETSHPKEPILYKLLEALNVDANYLFQDEMKKYYKDSATPEEMDHIKKYRLLNEDGKEKATQYVEDLAKIPEYKAEPVITPLPSQDKEEDDEDIQTGQRHVSA